MCLNLQMISVTVDGDTGLIKWITVDGKQSRFEQEMMWYAGMPGDNSNVGKRASGAYIFRPDGNASSIPSTGVQTIIYHGKHDSILR